MVKKFFALASITTLTGLVAVVGVTGCTTTEVVEETDKDKDKKDKDPGTKKDREPKDTDPTDDPDGDDENECYFDEGTAGILKTEGGYSTEFAGGHCSQTEADALLSNCFGSAGDDTKCEAALKANADCTACVIGPLADSDPNKTYDVPAFISGGGSYGLLNVYGCLAARGALPKSCVIPLVNPAYCSSSGCKSCTPQHSKAERDACSAEGNEACSVLEDDIPQECLDAMDALDTEMGQPANPDVEACTGQTDTFEKVVKNLCVDARP